MRPLRAAPRRRSAPGRRRWRRGTTRGARAASGRRRSSWSREHTGSGRRGPWGMLRPMNFEWPAEVLALRDRGRTFSSEEVVPLEAQAGEDGLVARHLEAVRRKAREAGLWLPQLPAEYGGLGLGLLELCPIFEEAGRSLLGPLALNCSAPDEGT